MIPKLNGERVYFDGIEDISGPQMKIVNDTIFSVQNYN